MLGQPLQPGQSITLKGRVAQGSEILIRGSTRSEDVTEALWVPRRTSRGIRISAQIRRGRLIIIGATSTGRPLTRVRTIRLSRMRSHPRVGALRRRGALLLFTHRTPGSRAKVELSASRAGPALREQVVSTRARRLALKVPRRARFLRVTGFRSDGYPSPTVVRRLP
jgi:hypothetical protein